MNINWQPLIQIIHAHQRFVLSSHVRPDADALGSEIGLARILESLGKTVSIVNSSATPGNIQFLDPTRQARQLGTAAKPEEVLQAEVHIVVDTSSWTQLSDVGKLMRESSAKRVVIDHHVSSDDLGAAEFKDTTSEATGALIVKLAEALGVRIEAEAATALFAAIATDTGWFRFAAVSASTMRIAGYLIECGASPQAIFRELYEQGTLAKMRLVGRALDRMKVDCDGELAYTTIEWNEFVELGAVPADTEDLVNECLKVSGTKGAFIAIEQQNRQVKVSFRSRLDALNVAAVAEKFSGGGHRLAAGATLPGPFATAVQRALDAMKDGIAIARSSQPKSEG
ncbi:DHH family phosphoesterase [Schlesneria paludicola]|uniref:DHH family phosphoesterase n=1 Tax=Schlesneria paludicola TaxID=360056 RepID=UPI00029A0AAC|nr:bifunctional oligoribonuclease/PAP phosphatase NrnA [Schlesneria paludicola]